MQIKLKIIVENCYDCPYRDFDHDAIPYCRNDEAGDGFHEYTVYNQNVDGLQETCPLILEGKKL